MAKLNLPAALLGVAVLSVGAVAIMTAQSDDTGVIGFPGTVHWSWATRPSPDIQPQDPNPAGPGDHLQQSRYQERFIR